MKLLRGHPVEFERGLGNIYKYRGSNFKNNGMLKFQNTSMKDFLMLLNYSNTNGHNSKSSLEFLSKKRKNAT